jgi:Uma2 family endonuclease
MSTLTHLMTAQELGKLDDDSHRHELIKGELLTMPLPKRLHARVSANLTMLLLQHARANHLGDVYAENGYHIERDPDTVLGPDVAFISHRRIAGISTQYFPGAPEVVVEILSPGDRKGIVEAKSNMWLEAGAAAVWLINPKTRTIEVRKADDDKKLLTVKDELTGDDFIPGFRCRVAEIFD